MKKDECEKAIRQLVRQWASLKGIQRWQAEMPSFGAFYTWLGVEGYSHYLNFRSVMGPMEDAERWFDDELGQAWRN